MSDSVTLEALPRCGAFVFFGRKSVQQPDAKARKKLGVGMIVPSSILDPASRCELEIWRALVGVLNMTLESFAGSEAAGTALERVSCVIAEQVERLSGMEGGKQWTQ
jgi:hypothetical protein